MKGNLYIYIYIYIKALGAQYIYRILEADEDKLIILEESDLQKL